MRHVHYMLCILLLVISWSCKKEKSDHLYVEIPQQPPLTASTVRLMNMGRAATELFINGEQLTSMTPPSIEGLYLADQTRPTIYFANGRLGSSYTIPEKFIRQDGTADVRIGSMSYGADSMMYTKEFEIKENVNQPMDYYNVLFGPHTSYLLTTDSLFAIPRSISPPTDPRSFKIRILNLSSSPDQAGLQGDMSLIYADGRMVNAITSNVAPGTYSNYIELPYGTYQFKVQTADGKILPGVQVNSAEQLNQVNESTGTMATGQNPQVDKNFTYAPLHTFQPGGIYTIMICASQSFSTVPTGANNSNPLALNGFRIITDITEPQNITYGKLQVVNALPGKQIVATVDDKPVQEGALSFGAASAYNTYIIQSHVLKITDEAGKQLATSSFTISGNDNYTAWVYPDKNGNPAVNVVTNNLSGAFYSNPSNAGDDGSESQFSISMPLCVRFLNLSTDIPEVTFTDGSGQLLNGIYVSAAAATQHLAQGQAVIMQPYWQLTALIGINRINAYASKPSVLPGDWLKGITPLNGQDFIARKELYSGTLPSYETGIYTVALAGSLNPQHAGDQPARMIIIKHNQ